LFDFYGRNPPSTLFTTHDPSEGLIAWRGERLHWRGETEQSYIKTGTNKSMKKVVRRNGGNAADD